MGTIMPPTNTRLVTLAKKCYLVMGTIWSTQRLVCAIWSAITASAVLLGAQYSSLCSLVPIARVIEVWAPVGWAPSAWWAPSGVQAAGSCCSPKACSRRSNTAEKTALGSF